jgi:MFS family permease
MLRGVIRDGHGGSASGCWPMSSRAPRIARHNLRDWVVSSAPLILTDGGLALSEPKAVGAQGSTKVLAASSLGSCLVFVSSAVVTVALAAIGRDVHLSPLDLQWVMNAELLPLAALTLLAGALGDRFGQKRIFLAGIALFGLGAAAIGFAPSFAPLIVGRFLQGLGGALILPNGLSALGHAFSADKKAHAVGIWSAAAAVASGVAPAIAGAILDHGSWRTTFMMLLPVVVGALAVGAVWIPKDSPTSHVRVDVGGAVLSTVGLGGLGAGLTSLTNGSGLNLWVLVTLIVGLGGLACLIVTERRLGDNAMLPPSLFASRSVVGANLLAGRGAAVDDQLIGRGTVGAKKSVEHHVAADARPPRTRVRDEDFTKQGRDLRRCRRQDGAHLSKAEPRDCAVEGVDPFYQVSQLDDRLAKEAQLLGEPAPLGRNPLQLGTHAHRRLAPVGTRRRDGAGAPSGRRTRKELLRPCRLPVERDSMSKLPALPYRTLTQIRREVFGDNFPGSALITITALAVPEAKIEIQGYAVVGGK